MKDYTAISAGIGLVWCVFLVFYFACTTPAMADCAPSIDVEPMSAGLARLTIAEACFPGQRVRLHYDTLELVRTLDANGHEANQSSGAVTLALDYESRARRPQDPDTCGMGYGSKSSVSYFALAKNLPMC